MTVEIDYAIPPLTAQEALEWIEKNEEHQFGYCSDGYDACDCAQRFVGVVLGRPGYHDRPREASIPRISKPPNGHTVIDLRAEYRKALSDWQATYFMEFYGYEALT